MRKLFAIVLICLYCNSISADNKETIKQEIGKLIQNGTLVLNNERSNTLISINSETLFVPASIIKILTSYIAINILGLNYKFKTEFFEDQDKNLAIKGWGDPYFISEEIDTIADTLKNRGITCINKLYLDNSVFAPHISIPGVSKSLNPYDALNSALVVNFNTVNIKKDEKGNIHSAEAETPLTPLSISKGSAIQRGSTQRINLSYSKDECLQYVGELVTAIFKKDGIVIGSDIYNFTPVTQKWNLIYVHKSSKPLTTVLEGLLKYSNNFIANQILLTISAEKKGTPATIENGREIFKYCVKTKLNIPLTKCIIDEASGISRSNKITGEAMMIIMEKFRKYASLLSSKNDIYSKSGTLTGVYNYAGYIKTPNGLYPYVLMLNQTQNNRDKIVSLLADYCRL